MNNIPLFDETDLGNAVIFERLWTLQFQLILDILFYQIPNTNITYFQLHLSMTLTLNLK